MSIVAVTTSYCSYVGPRFKRSHFVPTRSTYHVLQRELSPLRQNVTIHANEAASVIVNAFPVAALLIRIQVYSSRLRA